MRHVFHRWGVVSVCILGFGLFGVDTTEAATVYSNDFENPSSDLPWEAWPEWVDFGGGTARAVNGRIEWYGDGGNNQWLRLDVEMPQEYVLEFDFFHPENVNSRFSVWPLVKPDESIFDRHNYFLRENTHYFNGADTIPSGGPRNMNLPVGAPPHRLRFEVNGDHIVFLYKDRGAGGWILVDERDFPPFGEGERYIQLGNNHDGGPSGVHYVDNLVVTARSENIFSYTNNFNEPSSDLPWEAWPEWVDFGGGTARAVNDRIEWYGDGGNNQWIRLDVELPLNYVMEFDFFHPENVNSRFSVWPLVGPDESIADRYNYFLRENTHLYNLADTIPSGGPRNMNLPVGAPPHRLRFEVTGDHIVFLFKDRGEGGWILVDERDFPPFGDGPRYVQLGNNHDSGPSGVHYVDNFEIRGLADNRAVVERSIGLENFEANSPVPVSLQATVTGNIPSMSIIEGFPANWSVENISNGGVVSDGNIVWSFTNQAESLTLTYDALPPRLIQSRVAGFSGSVDSGDGEERIAGDTEITILLPYLYREAIDYDFSGSPVDGRNYPLGHEYGERYTQGMDGIPSGVAYERPGGGDVPAFNTEFNFPEGEDFHFANGTGGRGDTYVFDDYRDQGEVVLEHGASDTNAGVGSDALSQGDWLRYTFDFGEGDQVVLLNLSINTWGNGEGLVDVYVDNQFKAGIVHPETSFNAYNFSTVGPFEISGGVHSIVIAFPGPTVPDSIGRLEVVRVQGIGRVERQLTADGFFDPNQSFEVSLNALAEYGNYDPYLLENLPAGIQVSNISDGGQQIGDSIIWDLPPTESSSSVSYTVQPAAGSRFILFNGLADTGLPLADTIKGDGSVVNEVWIFGDGSGQTSVDDFDGSALGDPWFIEYGSDPSLNEDYTEGVDIEVSDGVLRVNTDPFGTPRFDEWTNGRRAPMVLRTDIPEGDWRLEAEYALVEAFTWVELHGGIAVTYNEGDDTDVSRDEYLFGFYGDEIRVELTDLGTLGTLEYHNITDEFEWLDFVDSGNATAKIGVTKRGDELIFSAQLPDRSWQLVGPPVQESRTPTRIGFFSKIWGTLNYATYEYDSVSLSAFDAFVDVADWSLY